MINLLGKNYQLSFLIFPVILLCGLGTILLNILYFIKFDESLMNMNMGIGCTLFAYSAYNLFVKKY